MSELSGAAASQILLLVDHPVNRRLLAEWIQAHSHAVIAGSDEDLSGPFDLCIMDGTALDRLEQQVLARKQAEAPVFLPVLLLVSRQDVNLVTRHLWRTVDEVVPTPIERFELAARLAVLLRARQYSVELEADRRRLAETLQIIACRYQSLFDRTADLVAVMDSEGKLTYVNPSWLRTLGPAPAEGLACEAMVDAGDRAAFRQALARVLDNRGAESLRMRMLARDGRSVIVEGTVSATAEQGELLCVLRDVTEKERLEEQLRQAQKMEVIGRLAGGVAHDFNNLLTVISGQCELALALLSPEHPGRQCVAEIAAAAEKAAGITGQLLAFSRRTVVQPRLLNLNERIQRLERILRRVIGEDIALEVVLDRAAGAVFADPSQLDQVIMNLVINSRDAMPQGGLLRIRTAGVELAAALEGWPDRVPPGRYALLEVDDSGLGMDAATLARIFEPFFTTKALGTGLGLSIVREIVAGWGGWLRVESAPNKGTRFAVYLPMRQATAAPEELPAGERIRSGWETILLAEDDASLRALVRAVLERCGYRVLEAAGPAHAVRLAESYREPIHLLLTDVIMPEISGVCLAERIRALRAGIKVLYMTGYAAGLPRSEKPEPGSDYLPKPFTPQELLGKVRSTLDRD